MWNDVRHCEENSALMKPIKLDAGVHRSCDDAFPFPVEGRHAHVQLVVRQVFPTLEVV